MYIYVCVCACICNISFFCSKNQHFHLFRLFFPNQRKAKYSENKLKTLKARNEYLLTLEATNASVFKYYIHDLPDIIDVSISLCTLAEYIHIYVYVYMYVCVVLKWEGGFYEHRIPEVKFFLNTKTLFKILFILFFSSWRLKAEKIKKHKRHHKSVHFAQNLTWETQPNMTKWSPNM